MIAATHEPVLHICTRTAQPKDALGCKSVGVNAQEGRLAWKDGADFLDEGHQ